MIDDLWRSNPGDLWLAWWWAVPFLVVLIGWHELGHLVAGRLVGLRSARLQIGGGPPILDRRIRGVRVVVGLFPFSGHVLPVPSSTRGLRSRFWVATVGGPLFDVALLAALVVSARRHAFVVAPLLVAATIMVIGDVLPLTPRWRTTDIVRLLSIPFWSDERLRALLVKNRVGAWIEGGPPVDVESVRAVLPSLPADEALELESVVALKTEDWPRAVVLFRRRSETASSDRERGLALNALAWSLVRLGNVTPGGEADRASSAAIGLVRTNPSVLHTRGAVLVELDRSPEALRVLHRALEYRSTTEAKVHITATMALAFAAVGNDAAVATALAQAARLDATSTVLAETRERLGQRDEPLTRHAGTR